MRVCLLSFEYPPDTGIGGIATYVYQLSKALENKNIYVEVICGSPHNEGVSEKSEHLTITRIKCKNTEEFRTLAPAVAVNRYNAQQFDLIECPEFGADGLHIKKKLPQVPLIVKLHTPRFLTKEINDYYYDKSYLRRLKKNIGLIYDYKKDPEYLATIQADAISSPSLSLKSIVAERWNIPTEKIFHLPYPYFPSSELLNISPSLSEVPQVLYMGRLETRKGVYHLSQAIPIVLKQFPQTKFIFLGKDSRGNMRESSMKAVLQKNIGDAIQNVQFIDHVSLQEIPSFLSKASICVFPSLWENFPNVCLEAMSAAKVVVGSRNGGMYEMLNDISGNQLVNPLDVQDIAKGLINALQLPDKLSTGSNNRQKILTQYGDKMIEKTIQYYMSVAKG